MTIKRVRGLLDYKIEKLECLVISSKNQQHLRFHNFGVGKLVI